MSTLAYAGILVPVQCWCGMHHAISEGLAREARERGQGVYCPLGHRWVVSETETQQLRKQLQRAEYRARANRDLLEAEERSHAATRGHLTRARKRAAAGICPCCQRSFENVARHMKSKHPDFEPERMP